MTRLEPTAWDRAINPNSQTIHDNHHFPFHFSFPQTSREYSCLNTLFFLLPSSIPFLLAIQSFPSNSLLGQTMFQRVRTAGRALPGNLPNMHFQGSPLSCMLGGAARLGLTIGYTCSCANVSACPRSNIRHRRCWDQDRCRTNHRRHR